MPTTLRPDTRPNYHSDEKTTKTMDKKTYILRFMLRVAIAFIIGATLYHVLFFKMVEANMIEEVSKRVFVSLAILLGIELFSAFIFGPLHYHFGYERRKKKEIEE